MQIKRYVAATMREAIAMVREEQGPDAVILSNRRVDEGMEVVAAIDYDETLIAHAIPARAAKAEPPPAPSPAAQGRGQDSLPRESGGGSGRGRDDSPNVTPLDPAMVRMRDEMQSMRKLLELQLAGLAWNDLGRREPFKAKVLRDLASLDIHPEIARQVVEEMPEIRSMRDSWKVPLSLFARRIPVTEPDVLEHGGIVAVVGPTGVGKTTTVAKMAARFALRHGSRNVALISTDTYRIGAREQLMTYARILNVPMHVAHDRDDLANVIDALGGRKLILIDTAGMSQRDLRLSEQFNTLYNERARIRVMLALSAAGDATCLDETVKMFERVKPSSCILTKLDEAASLGGPLSVMIRHGLPLAYLCNGQRVPEDLHSANGKRTWLVQTAVKLRKQSGRVADDAFLAEEFGKVAAHA